MMLAIKRDRGKKRHLVAHSAARWPAHSAARRALKRNAIVGLLLASGCALALLPSCAGKAQHKSSPAMETASAPDAADASGPEPMVDYTLTRKNDIRALWVQIRQWRLRDLKLSSEPLPFSAEHSSVSISELRICLEAEEPSDTEVCSDTCRVKDAICDNADDICRIADELGDDAWADDKCTSAKASCKEAKEQCCGCTE